MKTCGTCDEILPLTEYHNRGKGLQPNCKPCQNAINRERYAQHRTAHIQHVRRNKRQRLDRFADWKKTLKCSLCPEAFYRCLDFHHLDSAEKDFGISGEVANLGVQKLLDELAKCAVVCKNCHVKIHEGQVSAGTLRPLTKEQMECWQNGYAPDS